MVVIDDERVITRFLERLLQRSGYRATAFTAPRDALQFVMDHGEDIDMVILDLMMPDLDGAELFELIRHRYPALPIIIISGFSAQETPDRLLSLGRSTFLHKPFKAREVLEAIQTLIGEEPSVSESGS